MSQLLRTDEIQGDVIHEYDGIEEADNRLPRWWLMTFYGAIAFSFAYWVYYHTLEISLPLNAQYAKERQESMQMEDVTDEALLELAENPKILSAGRKIFKTHCVSCHADKGQGKNGPNLTDAYWLHGGSPSKIHETIAYGVPLKGMIAWLPRLGPAAVGQATAYLLSIRDTNVAGKAPEGKEWIPPPDGPKQTQKQGKGNAERDAGAATTGDGG